jgi:hypothetical protein
MIATCQRIIDGPFRHMPDARAACAAGTWAALTRRAAPERPSLFGGRGDWNACVELASSMCSAPTRTTVTVIPVWACAAYETPSDEWVEVHAIVIGSEAPFIAETGPHDQRAEPRISELATFDARVYEVGWVVPTRSYAPDIELALRRSAFGVIAGRVTVLDAIVASPYRDAASGGVIAAPATEVSEFASAYTVRVSGVPTELARAIEALSFTPEPYED